MKHSTRIATFNDKSDGKIQSKHVRSMRFRLNKRFVFKWGFGKCPINRFRG